MPAVPEANEVPPPPGEDVFVFPATLAQRRYWLLDQLRLGGNPALHMPTALRLRGPLDSQSLQRALNLVVARHEALRTRFESDRGQLRQIISPTLRIDLQAQGPFDLNRGPLLRARLVRLGPLEHLLEIVTHHIISDGWSNGILVRDLFASYTALVEKRDAVLPELSIQFADYAEWQQERIERDEFAAQRNYWREKLSGALPGLDLPYHRSSSEPGESMGETSSHILPRELADKAKALAARESASAFMIFFAIFQTLLHRYTGARDFLVTTPSANRERSEFESVIGPFVNPLILRANLTNDPTFAELLGRVRTCALEAFAHQDIPFESLLDEFRAARLQVNFHYDAGLVPPLSLPAGLTSEFLATPPTGAVYDLSLSLLEEASGLRLELEYNSALFDAATIERMLGHYETLLQSAVTDPTQTVSHLTLLTPAENPQPLPANLLTPLDLRTGLVERVLVRPDAMIARHGRRELSCAELVLHLENASETGASDLDRVAARIEHWRARSETLPPAASARGPEFEASLSGAARALRDCAELRAGDRVASVASEIAAAEEIGAVILANAMLIYPTTELLRDSAAAFASWLEAEEITVAFLPAALWNRLAKKARLSARLRRVIVTEGGAEEGTFGRVHDEASLRVCRRMVLEEAGGTIALDGQPLRENSARVRVQEISSGMPLPIGVAGEMVVQQPTGELARRLPNECIQRLGLIAAQRYAGGFRVDFAQTENALQTAPGILQALVRPMAYEPSAPIVAYILPDPNLAEPDPAGLRFHLRRQRAPNLALPDVFVFLKDVPIRSEDGRLDLNALPLPQTNAPGEAPNPIRPYLGLQLQLIAIWEEILGVRGIGIRDDFFDLGGNSLLAMRMLQRAELACGKVILPTTLFRHPTIEELAGEIAREARDESPALLRVHDAGSRTPFFYLHGDLSGGGFYSLKLSRALGTDQPFYVLPPQDIRALSAAPSIEEMAAAHLQALRAVRPKGPYVIGGFCIGGVVAYELAQQLKAGGETVERLLIIDASPDRTLNRLRWLAERMGRTLHWSDEKMVANFGRWAVWRARIALRYAEDRRPGKLAPVRAVGRGLSATVGLLGRGFRANGRGAPPEISAASVESERDLPSAFQWASAKYQPKKYDGPVALLLSEDVLNDADNVLRAWQELAPAVTVQPLRGSHLECITAHVEALAEKIEGCLQATA